MSGLPHEGRPASDAALRLARAARVAAAHLREIAVPALPPARRLQAEDVACRLGGALRPSERLLDDLDALMAMLAREAEAGTHHSWQADEHHVRGGWPVVDHEPAAAALLAGCRNVRAVRDAAAEVLDIARADELLVALRSRLTAPPGSSAVITFPCRVRAPVHARQTPNGRSPVQVAPRITQARRSSCLPSRAGRQPRWRYSS